MAMDPKDREAFAKKMEKFIEEHARAHVNGVCGFKKEFALKNRLGASGKHGEVYAGPEVPAHTGPAFAIKIMPVKTKNINELKHYQVFNQLVTEGRNPHFPLVYHEGECGTACPFKTKRYKGEPCLLLMKEYADGDLRSWLESNLYQLNAADGGAPFLSMWAQVGLMGFGLARAGVVHNDLHWGNLLYNSVPAVAGKYMYYRVGRKRVYVKLTGQHWTVWDFGLSINAVPPIETSIFIDMYRLSAMSTWIQEHYMKGELAAALPPNLSYLCERIHAFTRTPRSGVTFLTFLRFLETEFAAIDPSVLLIDPPINLIPATAMIINPRKPYKITG
jgi:hypothetical protein